MKKTLFIIIIIIITIIGILTIKLYKENYLDKIEFLTKDNLYSLISDTPYYRSLSLEDMSVRYVKTAEEYIENISQAVCEFEEEDKQRLRKLAKKADEKMREISISGFEGEKASEMKWTFGCMKGKLFENGLPHTLDHVIILPQDIIILSDERLIRLLIHEKVHTYQKRYPEDVDVYLNDNNYQRVKKREDTDRIRANPDIDDWVYEREGRLYAMTYNQNPEKITDTVEKDQRYEHPYEEMAIRISEF